MVGFLQLHAVATTGSSRVTVALAHLFEPEREPEIIQNETAPESAPVPSFEAPKPGGSAAVTLGGGATVHESLLDPLRLTAYAGHFASEGYEYVSDLLDADSEDIEALLAGLA